MFHGPHNKGHVLFPSVIHLRCTPDMREEVKARGGGRWLRSIIAANTRPPGIDNPGTLNAPFTKTGTVTHIITSPAKQSPRITPARSRKGSRRVSLDKRKRRKV